MIQIIQELFSIVIAGVTRFCVGQPYHKDLSDPIGYGSGFEILYKNKFYFLSANHVVSPDNERELTVWNKNNLVGVSSGKNDEKNHVSLSIIMGGWHEFAALPQPLDGQAWPVAIDFTFCDANKIQDKCINIPFWDKPHNFWIPGGCYKSYFTEADFLVNQDELTHFDYFVVGSILKVDKTGWNMQVNHKLHMNLKFDRIEDNEIVLRSQKPIDRKNDWAGLSGSPVLTSNGKLIGMLVRVVDGDYEVFIKPMNYLLQKIDQIDRLKKTGVDLHQSSIVVPPGTTMEDVKKSEAVNIAIEIMNEGEV